MLTSEDQKDLQRGRERLKQSARSFYKDYNAPTDQKVAKAMFKLFAKEVKDDFKPSIFKTIEQDYSSCDQYIDKLFATSIFADSVRLWAFLENPTKEALENDMAFVASQSIVEKTKSVWESMSSLNANYRKGHQLYVGGIMEMNKGEAMYPDANSTMRLTYGQVLDYYPRDGVKYNHITTLKGVMEKEDPNNWEFVVPDRLKELYNSRNYGPYALENGEMPVAFITNNDITGGNSGSPVINGKGELIGCAFDGNWEAMSGNIIFEKDLQRCISVDIRYILFIIDKYAGAKHLIDEMTIVK
jgi:hypothetical protein